MATELITILNTATDIAMPTFSDFFEVARGTKPFAWQRDLADHVADKGWPSLIDVPTGMGKTAALDVFVWHLASQAHLNPETRTAPVRAAFMIDRRLVVDSAFARMRELTRILADPLAAPPIVAVAARLRSIGATPYALVVQRMRGGITWEAQWVRQPDQPAIVCGTVDQIGSRLLQRGYGSSRNRMPIDTGLLGVDCLLMIDEAHLSSAMVSTAEGIRRLEHATPDTPVGPRKGGLVRLTATPTDRVGSDALRVNRDSPDANEGTAVDRLTALKRTTLIEAKKPDEVVRALTDVASALAISSTKVILVVCNTVRRARDVFETLKSGADWDTHLLIGRCRALERREGEGAWLPRSLAGRNRPAAVRPLILVATQTIEVGVDLDADGIVSEVAAVDALVQRFGRVDRLGLVGDTVNAIVGCPSKLTDDPVYGASADATWQLLTQHALPISFVPTKRFDPLAVRQQLEAGSWFDAGTLAFQELVDGASPRHTLFAPAAPAPVVIPQTLACWARTSPIPEPDEAVAPYLHGVDRGNPTVSVVWRAVTPGATLTEAREQLEASVARYPIRGDESLEVPLPSFTYLLRQTSIGSTRAERGQGIDPVSDLESQSSGDSHLPDWVDLAGVIVRSRSEIINNLRALRPGDVVVLASSVGGHDDVGWTGERGRAVPDIADLVERRTLRLRLDESVFASFGVHSAEVTNALVPLKELARNDDPSELVNAFLYALAEACVGSGERRPLAANPLAEVIRKLSLLRTWRPGSDARAGIPGAPTIVVEDHPDGPDLFVGFALVAAHERIDGDRNDQTLPALDDATDDTSLSFPAAADRSLLRHLNDVGTRAKQFAQRCGLGPALAQTLGFSGFLHDLGKAETRFQAMLRRGDLGAAERCATDVDELLAKSDLSSEDTAAAKAAIRNAGWPGLRHEAISLALARTWPLSAIPSGIDFDLALHLVATHHGYGRPWFPADRADPRPSEVSIELRNEHLPDAIRAVEPGGFALRASSADGLMAFDQPDRFDRLRRRYGFWGLCHLEAVLRLADMTISEELGCQIEAEMTRG